MEERTHNVRGVEVFSVGTWNGDEYTSNDLDEMIRAFNETSQTCRPALKLGHDPNQELLQKDGYPAAGWVGKLYRQGEKLVADFIDIPDKIFKLLEKKAYRNVSSEIYWDINLGEKAYKRMLAAVALLGADMPAVTNLKDIMATYVQKLNPNANRKSYAISVEGLRINLNTESGGEAMEKDLEQLESELKVYKTKTEESEKELTVLREYKNQAEAQLKVLEEQNKEALLDTQVLELEKEDLLTPAMKPYIRSLLGDEKKVYSFKQDDKEVEFSKYNLLKETLKLHGAKNVNKQEKTVDGEPMPQNKGDEEAIKKYMDDNKCGYGKAYRAVMRGREEKKAS